MRFRGHKLQSRATFFTILLRLCRSLLACLQLFDESLQIL